MKVIFKTGKHEFEFKRSIPGHELLDLKLSVSN